MSKEEKEYWKSKDPIPACEKMMLEIEYMDGSEVKRMKKNVVQAVEEAVEFGQNSPQPMPEDTYEDFYVTMEVPK